MLKKLELAAGCNRENTRYTNEGKWWSGDKIRFRQGTPEKIGGWMRMSTYTYEGVCRALFPWVALTQQKLIGVGTNLKYYVQSAGQYRDITPLRSTVTLANPFSTTDTLTTVTVTDVAHGAVDGDFVTFSGASAVGGLTLNDEYQLTLVDVDTYTIEAATPATSTATGGGVSVSAAYQINVGPAVQTPASGWGTGGWGIGAWGTASSTVDMRLWSHSNFGENLILCPRGGAIYYWAFDAAFASRAESISTLPGASDVPTVANSIRVSDVSRFVLAFGCNDVGSGVLDPMLIRWSDQEDAGDWTPGSLSKAGSIRLSDGSEIVAHLQTRQEILVWTDTALYSLQFVGAPDYWVANILASNISIAGANVPVTAAGTTYWMGDGKFYVYNGRVETLKCDLRQAVFGDFNREQFLQCFGGTIEEFNEIWWWYPSEGSSVPDKYVVYNYGDGIWYDGEMTRYAWLDRNVSSAYPVAAWTDRLLQHELGVDDGSTAETAPIAAYIESCEFDIDDGDHFAFIWRVIPDITFRGSTAENPTATLTLYPLKNSGSGLGTSIGGVNERNIARTVAVPVEQFTQQLNIRVRGRQMILRIESTDLGVTWQGGMMRLDTRQDGKR